MFSTHTAESWIDMQTRLFVARRSTAAGDLQAVSEVKVQVNDQSVGASRRRNATLIRHMACSRCIKYTAYTKQLVKMCFTAPRSTIRTRVYWFPTCTCTGHRAGSPIYLKFQGRHTIDHTCPSTEGTTHEALKPSSVRVFSSYFVSTRHITVGKLLLAWPRHATTPPESSRLTPKTGISRASTRQYRHLDIPSARNTDEPSLLFSP